MQRDLAKAALEGSLSIQLKLEALEEALSQMDNMK